MKILFEFMANLSRGVEDKYFDVDSVTCSLSWFGFDRAGLWLQNNHISKYVFCDAHAIIVSTSYYSG